MSKRVGLLGLLLVLVPGSAVVAQTPAPPPWFGGRVEMPEHGFAVTFPADWTVDEIPPETRDMLLGAIDPEERSLRTFLLQADHPDSDSNCNIVDFTRKAEALAWASVEMATAGFLAGDKEVPNNAVEPTSDFLDLPAGRTGRTTGSTFDGWTFGSYIFSDATAWFYLACASPEPPDGAWLSIAESFEFLPAEEE